jgi:hypothetical protein
MRAHERRATTVTDRSSVAGVVCRDGDVESTRGVHSVAILFRIMAGILVLLMAAQVISGLTGAVEISYGVLAAEAIRLIVFAGLLWSAGDLAELFVTSHRDLRATRILLARFTRVVDHESGARDAADTAQDTAKMCDPPPSSRTYRPPAASSAARVHE